MSTCTITSYGFNYARLSYAHELYHVVGWPGALKPHARAACGVARIAQRPGDRPTWEDCRTLPPANVCHMCMRARGVAPTPANACTPTSVRGILHS